MPQADFVFCRDWIRALLACCCCGFTALPVVAQVAGVRNLQQREQYFFDTYNVESGLPGVAVNSVCQTRDGFVWIATGGGLARFDGVHFTAFRPTNTPAFTTPLVYRAYETRDGSLWLGTARGLVRYRDRTFERMGLDQAEVHTLVEDDAGRLWIGTFGHGLFVRENGRIRHIDDPALQGSTFILRLVADHAGRVWIAADSRGVVCYEDGRFVPFEAGTGIGGTVEAICEQPAGTLWFGTRGDGLYRWREGELAHFGRANGLVGDDVYDLAPANDGGLWLVSSRVQRIDDPNQPQITVIPDLMQQPAVSVYQDREGSIWLSAKERGLMRGSALPYRLISTHDGLPDEVRSISQDGAGNLWLGAQRLGVMRVTADGELSMPLAGPGNSPGPLPTVVLAARDGAVWVGTADGLYRWQNGHLDRVGRYHGTYGLFEDREGTIWIGTVNDGIFRYVDGRLQPVPLRGGGPVLHATSFCEGPDRTLYAATWISGVAVIRNGEATLINRASGLPTEEVRAVYVDAENRLWLGFRGHGLGLWENGRCWTSDALAQVLFDHVSAIAEDSRGEFWLGTPAGVMWVAKSDLLAAVRGEKNVAELRIAQVTRTLRTASVWTGPQSVVCATRDGRLLFATRQGILAIDPKRLPGQSVPPPVYIERVSIDGHRLDAEHGLNLAAGAKNLVIDYTAPSFVEPGQVAFKYQLEGYDADWVDAQTRRTAAYGNLGAGNYTFRVIACSADGVWNRQGATLAIVQQPHFYQTGWFFGLIGAGFVVAGLGLHRWSHYRLKLRLERLEEKQATERERRRIAKNLHDDLGANLTEISLYADSIQQKVTAPELTAEMTELSERVRALAGTLDAIVWSANPANDSLDRLGMFVCGLFQDLCRVAGVRCRIDAADPLPPCPLTPDERSNLFLAAREAMTNVAKHARATEAWLRLSMEENVFQFTVEDNGCGFELAVAEAGNRNGLGNIRSRVAELKGTVTFDSNPGRGTKVTIRVPLKL